MQQAFLGGGAILALGALCVQYLLLHWLIRRYALPTVSRIQTAGIFATLSLVLILPWSASYLYPDDAIIPLFLIGISYGAFYLLLTNIVAVSFWNALRIFALTTFGFGLAVSVLFVFIRLFFFEPLVLKGESMNPTYTTGDYLATKKFFNSYERRDVVVHSYKGQYIVQRIIGLPGETVEIDEGKVFINNTLLSEPYAEGVTEWSLRKLVLEDGDYFMLGDNRENSGDSRDFGPVPATNIRGEILTKIDLLSGIRWNE